MIRNRTWRRALVATVLGADLVVVLVAGAHLPGFVPFAVGALVVGTLWALARPGGWGAFALIVIQVLTVGVPGGVPTSLTDWAMAAAAGSAVILTHLALTLLGSWPARADLPRATALRWGGTGGRPGVDGDRGRPARRAGQRHAARLGPLAGRGRAGADGRHDLAGAGQHPQELGVRRSACAACACGRCRRRRAARSSG